MIRLISCGRIARERTIDPAQMQTFVPYCITSLFFSSVKSQGDSSPSFVEKKIDLEHSSIEIQVSTTDRLPFSVWKKIHATLVPNDFSWKGKERRWVASITPMSKKASDDVMNYVQQVKSSIQEIHVEEKAELDKRWVKDEDAYIAKYYPEEHKKVREKILSEGDSKLEAPLLIEKVLEQAVDLLPTCIDKDRFLASLKEALEGVECLESFDHNTVLKAALTASALGLYPNSYMQQCYFIPFKDSLHFVIGYKGLIELSLRSGEVSFYEAKCVYEKDSFETRIEDTPKIWHRPYEDVKNRGNISAIYAIRVMKNGQKDVIVLSAKDINKIRKNKDTENSPWGLWSEEMCTKTLIKILAKQSELSIETQQSNEK